MFERHDADAHEALAGRETVGDAHEKSEIDDQSDGPAEFKSSFDVETSGDMAAGGAVDLFLAVKPFLEGVLQARLCGDPDHGNEGEIDKDGDGALTEGGQRLASERLGTRRAVWIKRAVTLGEHEHTIAANRPWNAHDCGRVTRWTRREELVLAVAMRHTNESKKICCRKRGAGGSGGGA